MNVVTRADEDLLLDLLNTTPVIDGHRVDELGEPGAGTRWATARGGVGSAAELAELRRVRDVVQGVVRGTSEPDSLGPRLAQVSLHPRLHDGALDWELGGPAHERLAARALLAWAVVHDRAPGRLRACANTECWRFLHDRSNANSARWCSMALCGNRAKARRHYQRSRTTAG